jgi:hypothetical protein
MDKVNSVRVGHGNLAFALILTGYRDTHPAS